MSTTISRVSVFIEHGMEAGAQFRVRLSDQFDQAVDELGTVGNRGGFRPTDVAQVLRRHWDQFTETEVAVEDNGTCVYLHLPYYEPQDMPFLTRREMRWLPEQDVRALGSSVMADLYDTGADSVSYVTWDGLDVTRVEFAESGMLPASHAPRVVRGWWS